MVRPKLLEAVAAQDQTAAAARVTITEAEAEAGSACGDVLVTQLRSGTHQLT
jgi:hypothetical protein